MALQRNLWKENWKRNSTWYKHGIAFFYLMKQTYFSWNERERISNVIVSYQAGDLRSQPCLDTHLTSIVFLRILEYYTGILFLTTNRVGMFDNAFKSRIHLPLYFSPLEKKETPATWSNLRRTLQRREPFLEAEGKEILAFAKSQYNHGKMTEANWNGRQIRNVFQIAAALAEFEAQKRSEEISGGKIGVNAPVYTTLNKSHFKTVTRASQQFDEYISSFGMTLSEWAAQKANRNDEFKYVGISSMMRARKRYSSRLLR